MHKGTKRVSQYKSKLNTKDKGRVLNKFYDCEKPRNPTVSHKVYKLGTLKGTSTDIEQLNIVWLVMTALVVAQLVETSVESTVETVQETCIDSDQVESNTGNANIDHDLMTYQLQQVVKNLTVAHMLVIIAQSTDKVPYMVLQFHCK